MPRSAKAPLRVPTTPPPGVASAGRAVLAPRSLATRVRALRLGRRWARLATGLERAVRAAETPSTSWSTVVPVQRDEVLATRTLMLTLASRIRAAEHPSPTTLALVHRLLTDGSGPLFAPAPPGALRDALIQATLALDDGGPGTR